MTCDRCGAPVYARDRCRACYAYWRRTGHERPYSLIARAGIRSENKAAMIGWRRFYRERLAAWV